jgi:hypothetical protein
MQLPREGIYSRTVGRHPSDARAPPLTLVRILLGALVAAGPAAGRPVVIEMESRGTARPRLGTDAPHKFSSDSSQLFRHTRDRCVRDLPPRYLRYCPARGRRFDPWDADRRSRPASARFRRCSSSASSASNPWQMTLLILVASLAGGSAQGSSPHFHDARYSSAWVARCWLPPRS